jgi:pimeloyl-ACP methyl ester carboxylesterase
MHPTFRTARVLGMLASLALVAGCSGGAPSVAPTAAPTASAVSTDYVADLDVGGGRTMHLVCLGPTGTGRPTVILEHGLGADYTQWEGVLTGVSATDRVCAYDRPSLFGQSKLPAGPRTTADQVADLHALLAAAGLKPPYILVGHSIGGWNNLVYAKQYQADVAGVVFSEVRPPALTRELATALPPQTANESQGLKDWRTDLTTFETDYTKNPEHLDLAKSTDQVLAAPGFGSVPFIVLARADASADYADLDAALAAKFEAIGDKLLADLVKLSSAGKLVKVEGTTHEIPDDKPQVIVDAIKEVLGLAG